jgi:hypothetical protein
VELALGQTQRALERYEQSLKLTEQIREQFGDSPERLRDLCVSHVKLAEIFDKLSNGFAARSHAGTALAFAREIINNYGETPDSVNVVKVCKNLCESFSENQS